MHAIITLVERDFLYGAAVLYNSLVANGFDGVFIIGHRGDEDLPQELLGRMQSLPDSVPPIEWVKLETPWHLTNFKAKFIVQTFEENPNFESITYFDPDIVVTCPWSWIHSWSSHGPAVCGDVNWMMPANHPTRHEWTDLLREMNLTIAHRLEVYFNGGFLGLSRRDADFANLWQRLIEVFGQQDNPLDGSGEIANLGRGGRWKTIQTPDQDTLNITAMTWPGAITTLGPDAMGFSGGWQFIPHALGSMKPWRRSFFKEALQAKFPRAVDRAFWNQGEDPIKVFGLPKQKSRQRSIRWASLLGRFYRRGGA